MRKRDYEILRAIGNFRVMSRDQICDMFFFHSANPIKTANSVLKRLTRDGHLKAHTLYQPYAYTLTEDVIKHNSKKLNHWIGIVECYRMFAKEFKIQSFQVEPKIGSKGSPEPDALMILETDQPFFIELQRKYYTVQEWTEKISRYQNYHQEGSWRENFDFFPAVWIVSHLDMRNIPEAEDVVFLFKRLPESSVRYQRVTS
jgi:Replication-relaxation